MGAFEASERLKLTLDLDLESLPTEKSLGFIGTLRSDKCYRRCQTFMIRWCYCRPLRY